TPRQVAWAFFFSEGTLKAVPEPEHQFPNLPGRRIVRGAFSRASVWTAPACWRFCSRHGRIRGGLACARGQKRRQIAAVQTLSRLRNRLPYACASCALQAKHIRCRPMQAARPTHFFSDAFFAFWLLTLSSPFRKPSSRS